MNYHDEYFMPCKMHVERLEQYQEADPAAKVTEIIYWQYARARAARARTRVPVRQDRARARTHAFTGRTSGQKGAGPYDRLYSLETTSGNLPPHTYTETHTVRLPPLPQTASPPPTKTNVLGILFGQNIPSGGF